MREAKKKDDEKCKKKEKKCVWGGEGGKIKAQNVTRKVNEKKGVKTAKTGTRERPKNRQKKWCLVFRRRDITHLATKKLKIQYGSGRGFDGSLALSHLEVAPRGVPLPSVEEVGRSHVVPGGVARRELDLRDDVLKESDKHDDLYQKKKKEEKRPRERREEGDVPEIMS